MTTETMSMAYLADLATGHLAAHGLPEPFSVVLCQEAGTGPNITVQVHGMGLAGVTAELLAWVHSLPAVSLRAWRPPTGDSVHLDMRATLTGEHGSAALKVFGGVPFDPDLFPNSEAGQSRPLSLGQLSTWAVTRSESGVLA